MKKRVITIGREFGSGGRTIGRQVAEKLGIEFYDKDIIKKHCKRNRAAGEIRGTLRGVRPVL